MIDIAIGILVTRSICDSARTVNITTLAPLACHYPALITSSLPPPTFPMLNLMSQPSASAPLTMGREWSQFHGWPRGYEH